MQPLARAGRNLALKSLGEALGRLCFFFLFIFAARVLGVLEYGRYSYAASLAALALVGMDLGLNTLFVRDGAREPGRVGELAGSLLAIKTGLALLVGLGLFLYCRLEGVSRADTALVLAVALAQMFWGMMEFSAAGLNALERMDQEALVRTSGRLAALALCGGLFWAGWRLWGLVGGLAAANAWAMLLGLWFLRRHGPFRLRLDWGFLAYLAREALPLALTNVFVLVYFRVDVVMLEAMGSSFKEIGLYAAGVRLVDGVGVVPLLVARSLLPVLSSLAGRDPAALLKLYRQGQRLLLILAVPAALGLWAVRQELVTAIYGAGFARTGPVFWFLAPSLIFMFLTFLQLNTLTVLGLQNRAALVTGVCAGLNVGLNLILIPTHGFMGAAAATLATNVCLFCLCAWFIRRRLGPTGLLAHIPRPMAAAAVMGLGLYFTRGLGLPIIIASAMALYGAALLAVRGITLGELAELRGMLRGGVGPKNDREGR